MATSGVTCKITAKGGRDKSRMEGTTGRRESKTDRLAGRHAEGKKERNIKVWQGKAK